MLTSDHAGLAVRHAEHALKWGLRADAQIRPFGAGINPGFTYGRHRNSFLSLADADRQMIEV